MLRMFGPNCSLDPVDAGALEAIPKDVHWIDLLDPTKDEERLVEQAIGQNVPTREEMSEIEPSSRLYERKGAIFLTASVLHGITGQEPDTSPISFILSDGLLVTVRYVDPMPFIRFHEHLCSEPTLGSDARAILVRLLDSIVDRLADELESTAREMEDVSGQIFRKASVKPGSAERRLEVILMRTGGVQRLLAEIRESAVSTSRMLGYLVSTEMIAQSEHKVHVESLIGDVKALLDHSNFLVENLAFLLDASLGLISLEQNFVMKVFSVVAVVFMPPTLIAGIYGMNFEHMPELDWMYGYPFALALILASAVLPYWIARRRGWL